MRDTVRISLLWHSAEGSVSRRPHVYDSSEAAVETT